MGFRGGSAGKESACSAGDPDSSTGLGRSSGERKGYPLQYSWASVVAQMVKNPPAMRETWVPSLGLADPLGEGREGTGAPLQYFAWRTPWMEEPGGLQSKGSLRVRHD